MCTVSWIHSGAGYALLCNRDEKLTRLRAAVPEIHTVNGVNYIAPVDGDFGGSWVATNEFGLTLALLNGPVNADIRGARSRGHLVTNLADARSIEDLCQRVAREDFSAFASFQLVVLEPAKPALLLEWDALRAALTKHAEDRMPLTSSSFDPEAVSQQRLRDFERLRGNGELSVETLFDFHSSHGPALGKPSAYSTCMHRPDAQTVSFTWVDVTESEVRFFYSPAAPCEWAPGETVRLVRNVNILVASRQ